MTSFERQNRKHESYQENVWKLDENDSKDCLMVPVDQQYLTIELFLLNNRDMVVL